MACDDGKNRDAVLWLLIDSDRAAILLEVIAAARRNLTIKRVDARFRD